MGLFDLFELYVLNGLSEDCALPWATLFGGKRGL